jgi:hypothetical protein
VPNLSSFARSWSLWSWLAFAVVVASLPAVWFTWISSDREWSVPDTKARLEAAGFECRYEAQERQDEDGSHVFAGLYVSRGADEEDWVWARHQPPHAVTGEVAVFVVIGQAVRPKIALDEYGRPYVCGNPDLVRQILLALR